MLSVLAVSNYRSLRKLIVPLKALNLVTGVNGRGKLSPYRAPRRIEVVFRDDVLPYFASELDTGNHLDLPFIQPVC
jgi:predicted ATPase